jgi:hypothetical protein
MPFFVAYLSNRLLTKLFFDTYLETVFSVPMGLGGMQKTFKNTPFLTVCAIKAVFSSGHPRGATRAFLQGNVFSLPV